MANPFEYREMLYKLIYEGELPEKAKASENQRHIDEANEQIRKLREQKKEQGQITTPSNDPVLAQLAALNAQAQTAKIQKK